MSAKDNNAPFGEEDHMLPPPPPPVPCYLDDDDNILECEAVPAPSDQASVFSKLSDAPPPPVESLVPPDFQHEPFSTAAAGEQ